MPAILVGTYMKLIYMYVYEHKSSTKISGGLDQPVTEQFSVWKNVELSRSRVHWPPHPTRTSLPHSSCPDFGFFFHSWSSDFLTNRLYSLSPSIEAKTFSVICADLCSCFLCCCNFVLLNHHSRLITEMKRERIFCNCTPPSILPPFFKSSRLLVWQPKFTVRNKYNIALTWPPLFTPVF